MDSSVSSGTDNASSNQMRSGGMRGSHANSGTTVTPITKGASKPKSSGLLTRLKIFFKRMSSNLKPSKGAVAPSQPQRVNEEAKVDRETIE